jgi:hypothetical protein
MVTQSLAQLSYDLQERCQPDSRPYLFSSPGMGETGLLSHNEGKQVRHEINPGRLQLSIKSASSAKAAWAF